MVMLPYSDPQMSSPMGLPSQTLSSRGDIFIISVICRFVYFNSWHRTLQVFGQIQCARCTDHRALSWSHLRECYVACTVSSPMKNNIFIKHQSQWSNINENRKRNKKPIFRRVILPIICKICIIILRFQVKSFTLVGFPVCNWSFSRCEPPEHWAGIS